MNTLTIGKLAQASGVGVETVRFYERKGLIKKPTTQAGAFRVYPPENITKIQFIKKAQELGFTLKEVKELMNLEQNSKSTCTDIAKKAESKIKEIDLKIQNLKLMKNSLTELLKSCQINPKSVSKCKVSDCFENQCQ